MSNPFADRHAELNRLSRLDGSKELNKSIIDNYTTKLRLILRDPTLSPGFVAKALKSLSESDIMDFADYAARKGEHPGKAFVGLCEKTMQYKTLS